MYEKKIGKEKISYIEIYICIRNAIGFGLQIIQKMNSHT